jgi:hypothetical protein
MKNIEVKKGKSMKKETLRVGVNLGGWISQYRELSYEHFDSFIVESDIKQIADWGFDHVRLPMDYPVIESAENPGTLDERGFAYVESCLEWCQNAGIWLVLDLHKAPGYTFTNTLEAGPMEPNTLFSDETMQERFISLWEAIANRYSGKATDMLALELLNEIVLPDSSPWNELAQKTINRLREIDPARLIVIGGNNYNAVDELQNIQVQKDSNLLHTFHFYLPMLVTHQQAPWVKEMDLYGKQVEYPGKAKGLAEFLDQHPKYKPGYEFFVEYHMDQDYLKEALQPAVVFVQETGHPVYCGEFGVIERASMSTRINWTKDFCTLLREFKMGYAYWSYKAMDFGLVDREGKIVSKELVKAVTAAL